MSFDYREKYFSLLWKILSSTVKRYFHYSGNPSKLIPCSLLFHSFLPLFKYKRIIVCCNLHREILCVLSIFLSICLYFRKICLYLQR